MINVYFYLHQILYVFTLRILATSKQYEMKDEYINGHIEEARYQLKLCYQKMTGDSDVEF
ncbi:hypothetical protein ELY21_13995 [Legionella sp. km535]|uniref:hypothetical protein n=1 Tax=Legionella sp. km535 TaxID=2498107 RepID=UPI000F8D834F|nr:hypothetical protein [Legionella sp. km535]RUR15819.1 hypothetical protein ELY21_13995 [Legionella sp. km535]